LPKPIDDYLVREGEIESGGILIDDRYLCILVDLGLCPYLGLVYTTQPDAKRTFGSGRRRRHYGPHCHNS
jgi:hypothetical protein